MPCSKLAPNARYLSKIPNHAQSQEVSVLCSFLEPIGECGLQIGTNSRSHKDSNDTELGSTKECEVVVRYPGTCGILQEVYQMLCPDHYAYGEIVEKG